MSRKIWYMTDLRQVRGLSPEERQRLEPVAQRYAFRLNDYYSELIDWDDPDDPLRRLVVPLESELREWGDLDASNESEYTPVPGCQHKYPDTVLLLLNNVCGAYCRYCFRKRLFMEGNDDVSMDPGAALDYVRQHEEITDVLLTGGDPLLLSTRRLEQIISDVGALPHVRIIRIGTKMTAFNPLRVLEDARLLEVIRSSCESGVRMYVMNHFDHPRELTLEACEAIRRLKQAGAETVNQCPIVRGVNDRPQVFASLFRELSVVGCPQYYVFQGRPTAGNEPYEVPILEGLHILQEANRQVSGLGKRARFVMSHRTGKIEILGADERHVFMRYHRARREEHNGRMIVAERDDSAYWLDQLSIVSGPADLLASAISPRSVGEGS